jgi:inosine-uridine nucleoside N-ribohydrolase
MEKYRVIIDTDPGVDDFFALTLALSSDMIEVEAFTIVFGNHDDLELLARNAAYALQVCKKKVPIYIGESLPLNRNTYHSVGRIIHGENGIGGHEYKLEPEYESLIQRNVSAADFIVDYCLKNPQEITLITLGPLTNIAKAILKCPDLPKYVKGVSTMGGTFNFEGNISPVAEANIHNDPESAKIVFNTPWKQHIIAPLNVTHKIIIDDALLLKMEKVLGVGHILKKSHDYYIDILTSRFYHDYGRKGVPCHDPCAIMSLIFPQVFTLSKKCYVDVETSGTLTSGMTIGDFDGYYKKKEGYHQQTTVLLDVNEDLFKELMMSVIEKRMREIYNDVEV